MILLATSDFNYFVGGVLHEFFGPTKVDGEWQTAAFITDPDEIAFILANDDLACKVVIKQAFSFYDRDGNFIEVDTLPGSDHPDEAVLFEEHGSTP